MDWLRLYVDILDDPKMAALSDSSFRTYVALLLLCRERGTAGVLDMSCNDIAWRLRQKTSIIQRVINDLIRLDILSGDGNDKSPYLFKNWSKRQFESDDVAVRVKRYRGRRCNVTGNVTGNVTCNDIVTPPDTDTDTDTDNKEKLKESFDELEYPPFEPDTPKKDKSALTEKPKTEQPKTGNGKDPHLVELQNLVTQVKTKYPKYPIETWYGKNRTAPIEKILQVLRNFLKAELNADSVMVIDTYLQKSINIEVGKSNARDSEAEHEARKKPILGEMQRLGQIMAQVGA